MVLRKVAAGRMVAVAVLDNLGLGMGLLAGRRSAVVVVGTRSLEPVAAGTGRRNRIVADSTAGMDPWLEVEVLDWCWAKLGCEVEHI